MVKFLPWTFLMLGSCATAPQKREHKPLATTHQKEWIPQLFISHDNWLGMNVDFKPINELRTQIEQISQTPLISREEAHITVITPPEYEKIKDKISMKDIESIAAEVDIQRSRWKPICVGSFTDSKSKSQVPSKTYYIVVESNSLLELRREVYRRYLAAGGNVSAFTPHHYFPHITIGYTEKDLYESDGAIKDTQTCFFDLVTPTGEKITTWNQ